MTSLTDTSTHDGLRASWEEWRAERTATLSQPHGWLSLTGLHWLDDAPLPVDGLPGEWWADDAGVHARGFAEAGDWVPAEGAPGVLVAIGDLRVEIIRRTGSHALRVRDPKAPALAAFTGVPVFEYDEAFAVPARFEPYAAERAVVVGAVVEGLEHHHTAVGTVHFEIGGTPTRLTVFRSHGSLTALFNDATSGVTTTGTTRSVAVGAPASDGSLVLDLNRATNLPCAFNDFATCPIPPAENRLTVAIEAGEKDPR